MNQLPRPYLTPSVVRAYDEDTMSRRKTQTTKDNVINPGVTVRLLEVMPDASGAPAVLAYAGYVFSFDMLGEMKLRLISGTGTRVASKIARDVCTHAYVTLLEKAVDSAWRELNVRMYDGAEVTA